MNNLIRLKENLILTKQEVIIMKAMTTRQQIFGDLNRQLSSRRRQMNADIREAIIERINKNRQAEERLDESLVEPLDLNKETA